MYRRFGKRLVDLLFSAAAIIMLSPVLALAALAVWLDDRHPPFFHQERVGRHHEPFVIIKFRTMPLDTEHVASASLQAPEITRVGRVLRRLSIDELPQMFNIVRGDMSVVGPRPALASQRELLALREASGSHHLRPGLTGLAQIRSYDGMPDAEKARHDHEYADHVTLRGDLAIIAKTVGYLFRPPSIY